MCQVCQLNERSRVFNLLLYPNEDESHKKALLYIENNFSYAYICHDRDKDNQGELKKSHTHIVVQFSNAKWKNSLAEELAITPNYIEKSRSLEKSLLYLIHYGNSDKEEYFKEEVKGPLKNKLELLLLKKTSTEEDIIISLLNYIKSQDYLTITDFVTFTCSCGLYSYYRRSQSTFKSIIEEHNYNIMKSKSRY